MHAYQIAMLCTLIGHNIKTTYLILRRCAAVLLVATVGECFCYIGGDVYSLQKCLASDIHENVRIQVSLVEHCIVTRYVALLILSISSYNVIAYPRIFLSSFPATFSVMRDIFFIFYL